MTTSGPQALPQKGLAFPAPSSPIEVSHDELVHGGGSDLRFDVYSPARMSAARRPATVIACGYRDAGFEAAFGCRFKDMEWTKSWSRLLASAGITTFTYSPTEPAADFVAMMEMVAADPRVDAARVAVFASSGHVPVALTAAMSDFPVKVACAAFLYGYTLDLHGTDRVSAASATFKFSNACEGRSANDLNYDLPLFLARAGKDEMPGLNASLDDFAAAVLAENAPLTLINHASGGHAFDLFNDSRRTRSVIAAVLQFMHAALDRGDVSA